MKYHYAGGAKLTENGGYFTDDSPTSHKYIGSPSPGIDMAWILLLSGKVKCHSGTILCTILSFVGLNISLDDAQAQDLVGRTFQWPESGLHFTGYSCFVIKLKT